MSVNRIKFFITTSRHINFTSVEMIANAKAPTLLQCVLNVAKIYALQGFRIAEILMDGEFKCLRTDLLNNHIQLNTCSESMHIGEIERQNRTVEEQVHGIYNTLPLKKMPG